MQYKFGGSKQPPGTKKRKNARFDNAKPGAVKRAKRPAAEERECTGR